MGVARSIERRLEGLMEGLFARLFRSGLQPVEVGRRILREMEENRTISVNRIYAPNDFRVVLGPEDHARFEQMAEGLRREFTELVIDQAKRHRWNLMGAPRVTFALDPGLSKGEFLVEASLRADPGGGAPGVSTRPPPDEDPGSTRAIPAEQARQLGLARSRAGAELVVLDDDGRERERITIDNPPVTVGRLSTNDVVLSDPNVSRRHAELVMDGGRWKVRDLGSTNGTLVNGKLVREADLADGDRLTFGTSELVFRQRGT